ncbi:uncharacterized protein ARMOST_11514 [Armillaria ostoyae]|uniref:Uncharacterized protein n=1 Tax=Armillaria ostoyae TaxID=47428 RepID=A0A284RHC9_ARMOS|nr:uncharacterized protein ARMOST_11514 [Armillaria ostoyae]
MYFFLGADNCEACQGSLQRPGKRLPELIGEIIDYFWDNKNAYSFVYQLFFLCTRVHLFHSIELKHTQGAILPKYPPRDPIPIFAAKPSYAPPRYAGVLRSVVLAPPRAPASPVDESRFEPYTLPSRCSGRAWEPREFASVKINKIAMRGTPFHASVVGFLIHRRELRAVYVHSLRELCIKYPHREYMSSIRTVVHAALRSLKRLDIRIRETGID